MERLLRSGPYLPSPAFTNSLWLDVNHWSQVPVSAGKMLSLFLYLSAPRLHFCLSCLPLSTRPALHLFPVLSSSFFCNKQNKQTEVENVIIHSSTRSIRICNFLGNSSLVVPVLFPIRTNKTSESWVWQTIRVSLRSLMAAHASREQNISDCRKQEVCSLCCTDYCGTWSPRECLGWSRDPLHEWMAGVATRRLKVT